MTALEPERPLVGDVPVRVWVDEGVLCAWCLGCDVYLEQAVGSDEAQARRAFLEAHPPSAEPPHALAVPRGWLQPLSGPGVFSQ